VTVPPLGTTVPVSGVGFDSTSIGEQPQCSSNPALPPLPCVDCGEDRLPSGISPLHPNRDRRHHREAQENFALLLPFNWQSSPRVTVPPLGITVPVSGAGFDSTSIGEQPQCSSNPALPPLPCVDCGEDRLPSGISPLHPNQDSPHRWDGSAFGDNRPT